MVSEHGLIRLESFVVSVIGFPNVWECVSIVVSPLPERKKERKEKSAFRSFVFVCWV